MSDSIGKLFVELGVKDTGFKQGMLNAKSSLQDLQKWAEQGTRMGANFSNVPGVLDDYISRAKAATGENARLVASANEVWASFEKGDLTAEETASALEKIKSSGQGMGSQIMGGMNGVLGVIEKVAAAAFVFKQTWDKAMDLGQQGAENKQIGDSFNNLTQRVLGTNTVLKDMMKASGDTIDDEKLMSSTMLMLAGNSDAFNKKMLESAPALVQIAKAVNALNPALGSTTDIYNRMGEGIQRNTGRQLKTLGFTVDATTANKEYAKTLGLTADQLDEEGQKMALLTQVLEKGKLMIDQTGGAAQSATDPFERLKTTTGNLWDTVLEKVSPALSNAADGMNLLLTQTDKVKEAVTTHGEEMFKSSQSYQEYSTELNRAARAAGYFVDEQGRLYQDMGQGVRDYVDVNYQATEGLWNFYHTMDQIPDDKYEARIKAMSQSTQDLGGGGGADRR